MLRRTTVAYVATAAIAAASPVAAMATGTMGDEVVYAVTWVTAPFLYLPIPAFALAKWTRARGSDLFVDWICLSAAACAVHYVFVFALGHLAREMSSRAGAPALPFLLPPLAGLLVAFFWARSMRRRR